MIRRLACCAGLMMSLARGAEPLEVPRTSRPPVIDGNLESEIWDRAVSIPVLAPARGTAESIPDARSTSVRVLWDRDALYVAFTCRDDRIRSSEEYERDENIYDHDVVEVFLHAEGAPVPYYELVISPLNQVLDAAHFLTAPPEYNDKGIMPDSFLKRHFWSFRAWNWEGLETATTMRKEGQAWVWTVEAKLPTGKLLRHEDREWFRAGDMLRANFLRYDWGEDLKGDPVLRQTNWLPVLTGCPHISPGSMGRLLLVDKGFMRIRQTKYSQLTSSIGKP